MKNIFSLLYLIIAIVIYSCSNHDQSLCQYKITDLLAIDTPKVTITFQNDTLTEVKDNAKDSVSGLYTFDEKGNLRFYGFFVRGDQYRYSEEYDVNGNLIKKEGTPLIEYRLLKLKHDTILFNVFIFSLNKTYENIQLVSNRQDTIRPNFLFKADAYSNAKCFPFKLVVSRDTNDFVLYTKGSIIDKCSKQKDYFTDTTSFKEKIRQLYQ